MKGRLSLVSFGAALACAGLFGCGGGGGGGGDSGLPQPPSTPVAITTSNLQQVTDAALDPAVGGTDAFGTSTSSADTPQSKPRVLLSAMQSLSSQAKKPRASSSALSDVPVNETCAFGGTVTGDETPTSVNINFNACSPEMGEVINGSLSASILEKTSTTFRANFNVNVTFMESGSQPLRLVGSFSINEACDPVFPSNCTGTFSGASLGAAHGAEVWFISGFNIMAVTTNGDVTINASYTVASSDLNGSVTVNTTSPIQIAANAPYPHDGLIRVVGANGSNAEIKITSADPELPTAVQVRIDANGDTVFDAPTLAYSWKQLEAM